MQICFTFVLIKVFRPGSFETLVLGLLVIPKATKLEFLKFVVELKKLSSVGFDPGQPPSI